MIPGARVVLRAPEEEDYESYWRWENDYELRKLASTRMPAPVSRDDVREVYLEIAGRRGTKFWSVETLEGELIGHASLKNIQWKDRGAAFGIVIGEREFWGRGFGTDATMTVLRYAFTEMNLHRISLEVMAYNQRAVKSYEKCGFQREGVLRDAIFRRGRYWDKYVMSVLSTDQDWKPLGDPVDQ